MQFKVKAAGVTHRVPVPVAPPQGGGGGLAVCTAGACPSCGGLKETEKNTLKIKTHSRVGERSARTLKWTKTRWCYLDTYGLSLSSVIRTTLHVVNV